MKIKKYLARDYANAMKGLLPPGLAWQWPVGGLGDALFLALAQELARLHTFFQGVLDNAINTHKPAYRSWHIDEYRVWPTRPPWLKCKLTHSSIFQQALQRVAVAGVQPWWDLILNARWCK